MIWYGALFIAVISVILFFVHLKKKQDALENHYQQRFAGKKILQLDKHALFVAQQSDGYSHFRGIGYLALTDQELYFKRQLGEKEISIPIDAIIKVGRTRRLGGQGPGKMMLKIDFKNKIGQTDAFALRVKDPDQWKKQIMKAINERP